MKKVSSDFTQSCYVSEVLESEAGLTKVEASEGGEEVVSTDKYFDKFVCREKERDPCSGGEYGEQGGGSFVFV